MSIVLEQKVLRLEQEMADVQALLEALRADLKVQAIDDGPYYGLRFPYVLRRLGFTPPPQKSRPEPPPPEVPI
jgi:hypothetical protein